MQHRRGNTVLCSKSQGGAYTTVCDLIRVRADDACVQQLKRRVRLVTCTKMCELSVDVSSASTPHPDAPCAVTQCKDVLLAAPRRARQGGARGLLRQQRLRGALQVPHVKHVVLRGDEQPGLERTTEGDGTADACTAADDGRLGDDEESEEGTLDEMQRTGS